MNSKNLLSLSCIWAHQGAKETELLCGHVFTLALLGLWLAAAFSNRMLDLWPFAEIQTKASIWPNATAPGGWHCLCLHRRTASVACNGASEPTTFCEVGDYLSLALPYMAHISFPLLKHRAWLSFSILCIPLRMWYPPLSALLFSVVPRCHERL